jgi:hypothetical protein
MAISHFEGPRPIEIENEDMPIDLAELLFWMNDHSTSFSCKHLIWTPSTWLWSREFTAWWLNVPPNGTIDR